MKFEVMVEIEELHITYKGEINRVDFNLDKYLDRIKTIIIDELKAPNVMIKDEKEGYKLNIDVQEFLEYIKDILYNEIDLDDPDLYYGVNATAWQCSECKQIFTQWDDIFDEVEEINEPWAPFVENNRTYRVKFWIICEDCFEKRKVEAIKWEN